MQAPAVEIDQQTHRYRTDPRVHDTLDALLEAAFENGDDPARDIAWNFWVYGFAHLSWREPDENGHDAFIFDPAKSYIKGDVLCVDTDLGLVQVRPGDYIRLVLDREKCPELPELNEDGTLGAEAVPWLEEWLRASGELALFLRDFIR